MRNDKEERKSFVVSHRKWIDIANTLGMRGYRTNCRGPNDVKMEKPISLRRNL